MSRDAFNRKLWFQEDFGSLSTDEWGCVPSLFIFWPEVSQHRDTQAVG